ncbi:MAG: GGDEF domain-containing protein [Anaerolineales bacterium]|nr:GGDEF domain-containing protein [Anaerolineales bacterium]
MTNKRFLSPTVLAKLQTIYNELNILSNTRTASSMFAVSLRGFLEKFGEDVELNPGEILFVQDEAGENLYWIEAGVLAILQGKLRSPHLLTFRRPGHIVGEIALLENVPRTASVAAITSARLKCLNKARFHEMLASVPEVGIELMRLLTERVREVKPMDYGPGMYDHLTGAFSRQALDLRLQDEIERAQRYGYKFAVVFIDLDKFKQINDTYGHACGDDVLVSFVRRLVADLRTTDLLFRYGGDEFILLLPGIDLARGPVLVQRLADLVSMTPILTNPLLFISFSSGIACYPDDGDTAEELLAIADRRLYHKKGTTGRLRQVTEPPLGEKQAGIQNTP